MDQLELSMSGLDPRIKAFCLSFQKQLLVLQGKYFLKEKCLEQERSIQILSLRLNTPQKIQKQQTHHTQSIMKEISKQIVSVCVQKTLKHLESQIEKIVKNIFNQTENSKESKNSTTYSQEFEFNSSIELQESIEKFKQIDKNQNQENSAKTNDINQFRPFYEQFYLQNLKISDFQMITPSKSFQYSKNSTIERSEINIQKIGTQIEMINGKFDEKYLNQILNYNKNDIQRNFDLLTTRLNYLDNNNQEFVNIMKEKINDIWNTIGLISQEFKQNQIISQKSFLKNFFKQ